MKRFLHGVAFSVVAGAIAVTAPSLSAPVQVKPAPIASAQNVNFRPPNVTAPGNRQGGTHRGNGACPAGLSITPLVPISNIGLTNSESPTFFAYVPQTSAQIEFTLLTENEDEVVYETAFKVEKPGIVGVSVPAEAKPKAVEVGKRYVWSFSMICDQNDRSADLVVKGWVQRIQPQANLNSNLANPDPIARVNAYAQNGIWYETVTTLAQLRSQTPTDAMLMAEWTKLLQSQGLESIADRPLVKSL